MVVLRFGKRSVVTGPNVAKGILEFRNTYKEIPTSSIVVDIIPELSFDLPCQDTSYVVLALSNHKRCNLNQLSMLSKIVKTQEFENNQFDDSYITRQIISKLMLVSSKVSLKGDYVALDVDNKEFSRIIQEAIK